MKFMSYRYLGYGMTDSNGEAKLEYDENGNHLDHSITGTGAGELDIVASLDKPIGSGSIVSETYEVLDCLFIGSDTSFVKNNVNIEDTSDGLKITPTNDWGNASIPSTDFFNKMPIAIEFEIVEVVGSPRFYFYQGMSYNPNSVGKYVATITSTGITIKKGDTIVDTLNPPTTSITLSITFSNTSSEITIKNYNVYPV